MRRSYYVILTSILFLMSCGLNNEKIENYYGNYRIIKVRENGKILNIDTLALVSLTEELYISAVDKNEDHDISEDEVASTSYSPSVNNEGIIVLNINNDPIPVEIHSEMHFDLIMTKIDDLGNETLIYLKKTE